jgi:glutamate synthase domain-containing protein 3
MMRKCHLNTCPVGIATQDEVLRTRFPGKPEYVERFMRFIAQEFREWMAELGFRTVDEMVGRVDRLETRPAADQKKAGRLDLRGVIAPPVEGSASGTPVRCVRGQVHEIHEALDNELLQRIGQTLDNKKPVRIEMPIRNVHRSIGATLSGEIARRYGLEGLPPETITLCLTGSAGQSLGAFLAAGVTLRVEGDANDYAGKGLSGGKVILVPPGTAGFDPSSNVIVGNVVLYGAVRGEAYIYGLAGERFAIRNSGAKVVVEGIGDHGCEYMTGGVVVVLGTTGYNFAAGMTGGIAYVYNESGVFDTRCNLDTVDLESVWTEEDQLELKTLIESHVRYTGSLRALKILDNWEACLPSFVKVMPIDYRQSLERMRLQEDRDDETVSATEEVYHG